MRPEKSERPYVIVFLTDGEPTVGETSEDAIVADTNKAADDGTRIFCFGLGTDVNAHLLDRIADNTHAASDYVLPQEDIEVKVSNFFAKIREPVLSNVTLTLSRRRDGFEDVSAGAARSVQGRAVGAVRAIFAATVPAIACINGDADGDEADLFCPGDFPEGGSRPAVRAALVGVAPRGVPAGPDSPARRKSRS